MSKKMSKKISKNVSKKLGLVLAVAMAVTSIASAEDVFKLESASLKGKVGFPEKYVANGFGCKGENISPSLEWSNAPKGTKSFAITMHDPDAPTESGFWHWEVYDIPATTNSLAEGVATNLPKGVKQTTNDTGAKGYFGACPPVPRTHNYNIKIHALSVETLPVKSEMTPAVISFYINNNQLAEAVLKVTHTQKVEKTEKIEK